jgi:hypothetical protein
MRADNKYHLKYKRKWQIVKNVKINKLIVPLTANNKLQQKNYNVLRY